jgi:colanic acid biosynthesis glycosyl transferase WcaI
MRIQLWSYNYDPEPSGIAPLSTVWAKAMRDRGHAIEVVAAHPHYPTPAWGRSARPYREVRDGIPVLRLPLVVGRRTTRERIAQELSFTLVQTLATPWLSTPDVLVAVSPSFPALAPAMLHARLRRRAWILWLQDILPEGAATTGIVESGALLRAAQRFERAAYRSARRVVVISDTFRENLLRKGVPAQKIVRIYNPASLEAPAPVVPPERGAPRLLNLGNIGHSQGLSEIVRAFERSEALARQDARLIFAGDGVAAAEVRAEVTSDRVEMLGMVSLERLEAELQRAAIGIVSQRADLAEFNVPSKLMNLLSYGIPVVASVRPGSEVERILERSGGGWVTDSARPDDFASAASAALADADERRRRGWAGYEFARQNLMPSVHVERFEQVLRAVQ